MKIFHVSSVINNKTYVILRLKPIQPRDAIEFLPGQYATLSLKQNGRWSPVRCFSFTNIPNESYELEFAFRITGDFTSAMAQLKQGDEVRVQGPFGDFTFFEGENKVVMIAGGIGITPIMSMLRAASVAKVDIDIDLLYSASRINDIPFEDDIRTLTQDNPSLNSHFFISEDIQAAYKYVQGPINKKHLEKVTQSQQENIVYYICGPESMMRAITANLVALGVERRDIITENFSSGGEVRTPLFGFTPNQLSYALSALAFIFLASAIGFKDIQHKLAAQPAATEAVQEESPISGTPTYQTPAVSPQQNTYSAPSNGSSPSGSVSTPATSTPSRSTYIKPRSKVS